jgi:protein gp37
MYQRFKWPEELSWDGRTPILSNKKPSRIFVCSTMEIFHPQVPSEWRDRIFGIMTAPHNKKHTFIVLTKRPERIDRPMPDNVWLGVSVTGKGEDDDRIRGLCLDDHPARVKFVSFEPLLGDVAVKAWNAFSDYLDVLSWVIVGRLTGHGHRSDPTQANIKRIYQECRNVGIPVFLKDNLRGLWKGPFVQELPMETCA